MPMMLFQRVGAPTARRASAVPLQCWWMFCSPKVLHFAGRLAPPRQYDVMNAPVYTHVLPAPTRPGALDFKRYDTHGVRC